MQSRLYSWVAEFHGFLDKHTCKERHHGNLKGWVQNCDNGPKHMDEGEDLTGV